MIDHRAELLALAARHFPKQYRWQLALRYRADGDDRVEYRVEPAMPWGEARAAVDALFAALDARNADFQLRLELTVVVGLGLAVYEWWPFRGAGEALEVAYRQTGCR